MVKKLIGCRAPGVDEIRPEFPKALDVLGLTIDMLLQHCMDIWDSASGLGNRGCGPPL